ncbi:MAG: S-adenosyl-L-methionine-binding protein [Methanoregulaceae archaeon PtaU1.Bin066]|nr:MAG: S-adenosyl-L-methionine-binding protein [Methanoregulaceae archaeon PtaU1.Bin066]
MLIEYAQIGVAHSPFRNAGAPPVHSTFTQAKGTIEIFPEYREGLGSLEGFSHLIVIYHFDRAVRRALKEPPLVDGETPHGIFATRHINRPNPIGISYVQLEKITDGILIVKGIDLLDGTPILDIKPYIPAFDSIPDATNGWVTPQHIEKIRNVSLLATRDNDTMQ